MRSIITRRPSALRAALRIVGKARSKLRRVKIMKIYFLIAFVFLGLLFSEKVYAVQNSAGVSAEFQPSVFAKKEDVRVKILKEFLEKYSSPLALYANDFIKYADEYDIDWKLVAAISGVESTFGREIPYESFNGWGWGIYGDNIIRFSSWTEGIQTVSQGLKENYINKWGATDVYEIGKLYASSPAWASRVSFITEQITKFQLQNPKSLSISL